VFAADGRANAVLLLGCNVEVAFVKVEDVKVLDKDRSEVLFSVKERAVALNESGKDVAFVRAAGLVVLLKADSEVVLTEIEADVALYEEANVVVSAHMH
jgi:hypothetical protein